MIGIDELPNSRDGYRVRDYSEVDRIGLWLELTLNGEVQQEHSREVWCSFDKTPAGLGERDRMRAVLEAVARFFNTGGSSESLEVLVRGVLGLPWLDWASKGFYLFTTQQAAEARHVFFHRQTAEAIDWQEDVVIVETTIDDVLEELREAREDDLDEEEDLQYC